MSDENAPKLRLKPKLGTDTTAAPQATPEAVVSPSPEAVQPVAAEAAPAPRLGRLRPKLVTAAESSATPAADPATEVPAVAAEQARAKPRLSNPPMDKPMTAPPMMMTSSASAPAEPATEPAKPAVKFGLKPKSGPSEEAVAPTPAVVESSAGVEPAAESAVIRKVTGAPFPPPGKFPPPAGLKKALAAANADSNRPATAKTAKSGKKLIFLVGGLVALCLLLGGGFFAYQKFSQPPPAPPKKTQPVAKPAPVAPPDAAAAPATKPAPTEAVAATVPAPNPDESAVVAEAKPAEEAKPVAPPPPPPPTVAFRGWVENLQIRGLRAGANPRVFIGNSSYGRGDLVNPKLNITFEGINEATRMLIFKDKTGATVERRQ